MSYLLNKQNRAQHGNPIVWGILIFIILLFSLVSVVPATQKWLILRTKTQSLENLNTEFEAEISRKNQKLSTIKKEFNLIAKDYLKAERLLFPENLDTSTIAKVLELYSLQYSLIDSSSEFILNSVSFSKQETENFTKTSANISVSSNEESLKDFIYFIQNNELPSKLVSAQNSSNSLLTEISTKNFLNKNTLPVANIESIFSSKEDLGTLLNTDIQISFFSQKINNEQG